MILPEEMIFHPLNRVNIYFISDPYLLLVSMIGVGIAWAGILSIPYAMLSSILPANKMGYYMGFLTSLLLFHKLWRQVSWVFY